MKRAGEPPCRRMPIWAACFDLALEILKLTRILKGPGARFMAQRLVETSSSLPATIARGQAGGSARQALGSLDQVSGELCVLETQLLICQELGLLPIDEVRTLQSCIQEIRGMGHALACRVLTREPVSGRRRPSPGARRITRLDEDGRILTPAPRGPSGEGGGALVLALVVSATLAALGLAVMQIADVSQRIPARARDREAVLRVAESGARAVKRWFDAPVSGDPADTSSVRHRFLEQFDLRDAALFRRTLRRLDTDGDPATPAVAADGSPGRELYRQGRLVSPGLPHLDLFQKPFRGDTVTSLMGSEGAADLVLEDQPGTVDLLDRINAILFEDQATAGRLDRIEVHAPPMSGTLRLGMATVTVTASLYPRLILDGGIPVVPVGQQPVATSVVRMGLAEIPFNHPRGPLAACGDLTVTGRMRGRWGPVTAAGNVTLPATMDELDAHLASGHPFTGVRRHISGADLTTWETGPITRLEDPWLQVLAGGELTGWEALQDQPFPFDPANPGDRDHSNIFQRVAGVGCPRFEYALWKRLASTSLAGDAAARYHAFDPQTGLFRLDGTGPARSVREWTHGRHGIFFFDTADGRPPDGSNLTPAVLIEGGEWSTAGFIYLNAVSIAVDGAGGVPRVILPPGEPYDDVDGDRRHGSTEAFVNLQYALSTDTGSASDEFHRHPLAEGDAEATSVEGERYAGSTTTWRDEIGLPMTTSINLFGILYNAGDIVAQGSAAHYGSLVAGGSFIQSGPGADSPIVFFDERIALGTWPPPEIRIPRTVVTLWQTQRP
ncbi:MAG: four helix bundle protein [Candidatus Polarisedimenticolia bacterium]